MVAIEGLSNQRLYVIHLRSVTSNLYRVYRNNGDCQHWTGQCWRPVLPLQDAQAASEGTSRADRKLDSAVCSIASMCSGQLFCLLQVEGRGNGIKTCVVNNVEIAKALERPPECEFPNHVQFLMSAQFDRLF